MDFLWSPWRYHYIRAAADGDMKEKGCVFCWAPGAPDLRQALVIGRAARSYVILNLYPYTNGHLMVAPYEHLGQLQELPVETTAEMITLSQRAMDRLEKIYEPHGYNVGFNQGRVAGAGVEHHIHMHVVPRWGGDTNFMPVLGDTRVMNQTLEDSYETLLGAF